MIRLLKRMESLQNRTNNFESTTLAKVDADVLSFTIELIDFLCKPTMPDNGQ